MRQTSICGLYVFLIFKSLSALADVTPFVPIPFATEECKLARIKTDESCVSGDGASVGQALGQGVSGGVAPGTNSLHATNQNNTKAHAAAANIGVRIKVCAEVAHICVNTCERDESTAHGNMVAAQQMPAVDEALVTKFSLENQGDKTIKMQCHDLFEANKAIGMVGLGQVAQIGAMAGMGAMMIKSMHHGSSGSTTPQYINGQLVGTPTAFQPQTPTVTGSNVTTGAPPTNLGVINGPTPVPQAALPSYNRAPTQAYALPAASTTTDPSRCTLVAGTNCTLCDYLPCGRCAPSSTCQGGRRAAY